jgi:phage tail-like protein
MPDQQSYPYLNLLFEIKVAESVLATFSECTGLSLEVTTEDYHEGGENRFVHKLPTVPQVPNLVLKRGMTESTDLWDWFVAYPERGEIAPKNGEVLLQSLEGTDKQIVRSWAFTAGYPVKWTGPELNAMSPGVAFEALEIAHRGIRVRS